MLSRSKNVNLIFYLNDFERLMLDEAYFISYLNDF